MCDAGSTWQVTDSSQPAPFGTKVIVWLAMSNVPVANDWCMPPVAELAGPGVKSLAAGTVRPLAQEMPTKAGEKPVTFVPAA